MGRMSANLSPVQSAFDKQGHASSSQRMFLTCALLGTQNLQRQVRRRRKLPSLLLQGTQICAVSLCGKPGDQHGVS